MPPEESDDPPRAILDVRFYQTQGGGEPVRVWLKALSKEDRTIIGQDLKTVQWGWPIGMPLVKNMGGGLWEARSTISTGEARVLFATRDGVMLLLHAFTKKTRATPDRDLKLARRRLADALGGKP